MHHAGRNIPGENRTRICLLGGGGSDLLSYRDEVAEHQGIAPRTPWQVRLFSGQLPRLNRTCSLETGSPTWTRTTTIRLTGGHATFTSSGNTARTSEAAEGTRGGWREGEIAPGTSAVRSGACSISYTLRALLNGRAPRLRSGYLAVPGGADFYLPRARYTNVSV